VNLGTKVIDVQEFIKVTDTPGVLPSAMIPVAEVVKVTDTCGVLPSAMIAIQENIKVTDAVDIPDVTAPKVTPPADISIGATESGGARGNIATSANSRKLHDFLLGGTATDDRDPAPVRLTPQITVSNVAVDATDDKLFPIGQTTIVTFRIKDAAENIGTATANVFVTAVIGGIVGTSGVPATPTDSNNNPQPIQVTFAGITQSGLVTAEVMLSAPLFPTGFTAVSPVYDIVTTALYTGPVDVRFVGTNFTPLDRLYHFQNDVWVDVTIAASPTDMRGSVNTLSPFVVLRPANHAPTATASGPASAEATSSAGASVTFTGSGSDSDVGDTLSFVWSEGATTLGSTATITLTLPVGSHNLTLTVTDNHGASSTAFVWVSVQDTKPPVLLLPGNQTLESTCPAGAVATFMTSASDIVDGVRPVTCFPASGSTFPLGVTTVSCTSTNAHGNTAPGSFAITVRDTMPPVVTPPASITIPATEAGGARGSAWPALAAFLAGATAKDIVDVAPTQLPPLVGGSNTDKNTLFPIAMTTVTFRFRDASNNIGSATANVTVSLGTVKISGQVAGQGKNSDGTFFVDVKLTNTGTGNARKLRATALTAIPTKGNGKITIVSPAFPKTIGIGNLDVGASQIVHVVLKVPTSVAQFALVEGGDFVSVKGALSLFALTQTVTP
jgi:hypothetical protein